MHRLFIGLILAAFAASATAAERTFDFSAMPVDQPPKDCLSTVSGTGNPGTWKVIMDDFPKILQPLTSDVPATSKKAVVAQLATDFGDEHFPMLILGDDVYGDFTFTTRFKTVGGILEQMAGVAFRIQDEKNYYVVRASSLGNNLRFYKVVNGQRGDIIGPELSIPTNVWHELTVDCKGTQIHCLLDGKEIIPMLTDNSFSSGKIAFWTKSDSISYFTDAHIVYTPHEPFVQGLIRETLARYPKVLGLKVFRLSGTPPKPFMIASNDEKEIGRPGEPGVADVINTGHIYYGKEPDMVSVVIPLRDRNGDALAAVRVLMKTFKGQTEENAIVRAVPIVKHIQDKIATADDLN